MSLSMLLALRFNELSELPAADLAGEGAAARAL
jgi:hypothetical protein